MATSGRWSPNKVRKRLLDDTWVFPNSGMVLMRPTSIVVAGVGATASIGVNGSVTFTSATSLSLNGVFTSAYDNYMIVMRHASSGSTEITFKLRSDGTDNSTANSYVFQLLSASGTTIFGNRYTQTPSLNQSRNVQRAGFVANFYGPFLSQPTAYRTLTMNDDAIARIYDCAGTHNQSTSYDGLTIFAEPGLSITGLVSVYGLGG